MSLEYTALAFFKEKKINYYYDKPFILFPCPYCSKEAKMLSATTAWKCNSCEEKGNLTTILKSSNKTTSQVYHPLKERKAIRQQLQRIGKKYDEDVSSLIERMDKLIEYHQNKK